MLPDINLLPKYERQNSLPYILFLSGVIVSLLMFALLIFFYFNTKGSLEDSHQNLSKLNQEKSLLEEQLASLNTGTQGGSVEDVVTYIDQHMIPSSFLVGELLDILPDKGYLSDFNYNYQSVDIVTQFETMSDAAAYVVALNQSEYVKNIQVGQMNTMELDGQDREEENEDDIYSNLPRYNVSYSIDVDQATLREAGERNE